MNQVRVHGDPFGEGPDSSRLRSFLRLAVGCGMRCSLSLSGVRAVAGEHERVVALTDGVRDLRVGTCLPPAEIDLLLRAAGEAVAATAPVVVFAPSHERLDARLLAGLEWPLSTAVVAASENHSPQDLLERVRAESRWAGSERPHHALSPRELRPWLDLPPVLAHGPVVHIGGEDVSFGTDLLLAAWSCCDVSGARLRLVVPPDQVLGQSAAVERALGARAAAVEIVAGPFAPMHVADAVGVVLPLRSLPAGHVLVAALASGRPVAASRWAETAALFGRPGTCLPIGGRLDRLTASDSWCFTPDARSLVTAVRQLVEGHVDAAAMGARARVHVQEHFAADRPAAPPAPPATLRRSNATVVLEAPFFETSSSSELSIETARALCRRGNVDLHLVPTPPFAHDVAVFRRRAPELVEYLCRTPADIDLWLSSGWPVRANRPPCRVHALRVDWEYGSLPVALTPHVDREADLVVVHSEHVRDVVQAAGRPAQDLRLIPHGVDAAMHEHAPPNERVLAWKAGRPVVLFCGGLIWRKGLDAFFAAAFAAYARNPDFVLVVKSVGHDRHYGRHHLRELVDKVQRTPGAPPLLLVTDELDRAQLASLYTACDVLLHPYRGEGFGLPILEARACGLPVVATAGGGADAMLTGPGAFGIEAARRAVELPEPHVDTPWVLEPSSRHAAQLLRAVLDDLPAKRAAARQFAGSVRAAFTWEAAAEQIEQMAEGARAAAPAPAPPEPIITLPTVARRPVPALR